MSGATPGAHDGHDPPALGVGNHRRRSYSLWREGKPPEFVMEVASISTWKRDRDEKPALDAMHRC